MTEKRTLVNFFYFFPNKPCIHGGKLSCTSFQPLVKPRFFFFMSTFFSYKAQQRLEEFSIPSRKHREEKRWEGEADSERLLIAIQLRILTRIMNTAPHEPQAEPAKAPHNHQFTCVIAAQTSLVTEWGTSMIPIQRVWNAAGKKFRNCTNLINSCGKSFFIFSLIESQLEIVAAAAADRSHRLHCSFSAPICEVEIIRELGARVALQSPQSVGVMMWTESSARQLPRASLMMLRLRARRPPDNLTPVGSEKLCFSPRSNFLESEWRSYSRFTNERKSLCFGSQSDFDLHRANTRGILGALGADVAQRQNTQRAPEKLHLIYFGCFKTHWRA